MLGERERGGGRGGADEERGEELKERKVGRIGRERRRGGVV